MKNPTVFYFTLLLIWIAACTYTYVCLIRDNCNATGDTILQQTVQPEVVVSDSMRPSASQDAITAPAPLTLYFATGATTCVPTEQETEQMDLMASYILANPLKRITVRGHADVTGPASVNERISLERAEFVKQLFMSRNVDPLLIQAEGRGELEPASDDASTSGLAKSRRVEIQIN